MTLYRNSAFNQNDLRLLNSVKTPRNESNVIELRDELTKTDQNVNTVKLGYNEELGTG